MAGPVTSRPCVFCEARAPWVDYKDVDVLRRFIGDRGRVRARRASGACARHQREMASAIKTARELALLPYMERPTAVRRDRRARTQAPAAIADRADVVDVVELEEA